MEIFKKVFKQTSWQLIGKAISSIATVISLGFITRTYGPAGTGLITLVLTYLAFFSLAVDFGLNAYILPLLLEHNFQTEWRRLFGFRLLLALVLITLALILPYFFSPDSNFYQLVLLGGFFAIFEAAIYISVNAIFQAKLRYDLSTLAYAAGAITELLLIIFLSLNHASLSKLILAYSGGWLVTALLALLLVKKYIQLPSPIFDISYFKILLKGVWPISLTLILNTVYFRVDSFILQHFYSFSEVGIYNVAYSVFQSALVVPTFIMNAFYPLLLKNLESGRKYFYKIFFQGGGVMLVLGLGGTILTLILAPLVIGVITGGKGFSGSITALQILALGFPAYFLSALAMWTLVTLKKYKLVLVIYIIGLVSNLILNWIFIPLYSFYAASYITGICEYLILFLQLLILGRHFYESNS